MLIAASAIVATGDSAILGTCWLNLARQVVQCLVPAGRVVPMA